MSLEVKLKRTVFLKLPYKSDLCPCIQDFIKQNNISLGKIEIIGAVTSLKVGYYNQTEKQYIKAVDIDKKLEIASCIGNITLKESIPFAHLHIVCADHEGNTFGGHLMPGTFIFAGEAIITEYSGGRINRKSDEQTGLPLWENI